MRIPQRLSTHIVPGLWLTWLPDASWPCSITTWYPCQTSLGSLLCHAGSQGASEPALCLAPLPFLVQEGAPCLCRETLRTHPSPNLCAVPKALAEPAPAGFPSSSPTRGFSPSCSVREGDQRLSNSTSSLSRTRTTGKRRDLPSVGKGQFLGQFLPPKCVHIHWESCQNSEQAIWEVPETLQFSDSQAS